MIKELVCIVCPVGCTLKIEYNADDKSDLNITGNKCPRGAVYGKDELVNPKRVLTTTAVIRDENHKRIPVKTDGAIPKGLMFEAMKVVNDLRLHSPIYRGDVLIENFMGTGVNLVSTKTVQ